MIISLINMEYNDTIKENIVNIREQLIKKNSKLQINNSIKAQLIVITNILETLEIELINLSEIPYNDNGNNLLELEKDNKVIRDLIPIAILYRFMLGV